LEISASLLSAKKLFCAFSENDRHKKNKKKGPALKSFII